MIQYLHGSHKIMFLRREKGSKKLSYNMHTHNLSIHTINIHKHGLMCVLMR